MCSEGFGGIRLSSASTASRPPASPGGRLTGWRLRSARQEAEQLPSPAKMATVRSATGRRVAEEIVRAELREPVRRLVRRVALDLAREEAGRVAVSLNGEPAPAAELVADGPRSPQDEPRALGEPPGSPPETFRRCRRCGEAKLLREAFELGRHECRTCRARRKREEYAARRRAAQGGNGSEPEPG